VFKIKKTIIVLLLIFVFSIILSGCSIIRYAGWQSVSISEVGTFKVPKKWVATQEDNVVYFTDKPIDEKGYKIYLIGKMEDDREYVRYTEYFENTEFIKTVRGRTYSNEALYSIVRMNINGNIEEKYILIFYNTGKQISLLAWDNLVDEDTINKIVKSYARYSKGNNTSDRSDQ
jgi:hypothetical protein